MACRQLFINSEDFKNRVDISENVEARYLTPYIGLSQDRYLKIIICKEFYTEIETQLIDDTLTTANRALLDDYIKPALVYRTYERYLTYANYKSTPAGIRVLSDEDSTAADTRAVENMSKLAASDAVYYEGVLSQFLEDNKDDYPTWRDNCKCVDSPSTSDFKISSIGKGKKTKGYFDDSYPEQNLLRRDTNDNH